jgi:tetratricopeptide (TPR) repeat protein
MSVGELRSMSDRSAEATQTWNRVLDRLPGEVLAGAELCALTPNLDELLATLLLKEAGHMNGTTPRVLNEVRCLPFVTDLGETFAVSPNARPQLVRRLEAKPDAFRVGQHVLSSLYSLRYRNNEDKASPGARRLQWNAAYHLAPIDPGAAVAKLDEIVQRASKLKSLSDMRAVVELTTERSRWLSDHALDVLYYEGKLAYEEGKKKQAEEKLSPVWTDIADRKKKISSGMYLGQLWAAADRGDHWDEGVEVLERTAELAGEASDEWVQAIALNVLSALRKRRKAPGDRQKMIANLRESIELSRRAGNRVNESYSLSALASALLEEGLRDEAETYLRASIQLERTHPNLPKNPRLRWNLGRLLVQKGPEHYDEATEIFEAGISRAETKRDPLAQAIYLEGLAEVARARGGAAARKEEAELLSRSLEMGHRAKNLRHQAIVTARLSQNALRRKNLKQAEELQEQVVRLNERRNDREAVKRSKRKLKEIRAKRTGEPGLEPG